MGETRAQDQNDSAAGDLKATEAAAEGSGAPDREEIDLREKGGRREGEQQTLDRRLFMQFLGFGDCVDTKQLFLALGRSELDVVLYKDLSDPRGIGMLTITEDPMHFAVTLRELLLARPFNALTLKPELTMMGRTYALGYEPDLKEAVIGRPLKTVMNNEWPWAIWYPLRRKGDFATLPEQDQRRILTEHGSVGIAFGRADHAHDVRLKCHGLDKNDNDFVIGLMGKELYPLSAVVERMRSTEQTSRYLEKLGPFFVGKAIWQGEPVEDTVDLAARW